MSTSQNTIESALFRSYWDDGLLDVLCGLGLLMIGLGWDTGLAVAAAVTPMFLLAVWVPVRRRVIEPRIGFVEFSRARRERTAHGLRATLALGVGTFLLALAVYFFVRIREPGAVLVRLIPGLPAVLLAVGASLAGLLTGARRFHAYGLALVAAAAVTVVLARGPVLPLVAGGLIVLASGTTLLTRFLSASNSAQEGT